MSMLTFSPGPGESRTTIIVWETDDQTKVGDPRYWWTEAAAERVRRVAPDRPDLTGKPKGLSLASLRQEAEDDQVEWVFPGALQTGDDTKVRFSLSPWKGADPDRTYFIVGHWHKPTSDEQAVIDKEGSRFPPEVKEVRQKLRAAVEAHNDEQAQELRDQLQEVTGRHGFIKARDLSPWDPAQAVEVQTGVFVQDERPDSPASSTSSGNIR